MKPGEIINTHLCDICKQQIPVDQLNTHLKTHTETECRDGFNCRFCKIPITSAQHEVQHTWEHRQAGHLPVSEIGCPQCFKVGDVEHVLSAQYEPGTLYYRCKCGHLFDSTGHIYRTGRMPPIITKKLSDLEQAALEPGPVVEVSTEQMEVIMRGPGVKLDNEKDDLWLHVMDNFPLSLGWLAAHMKAGDNEPGHVHHGWRTVDDGYNRYSAALLRHLMAEKIPATVSYLDKVDMAISVLANAFIRAEILLRMDVTNVPGQK